MTGPRIPNVLADRYASPAMRALWSPEAKIRAERELWLSVMRAQAELGVDVSVDVIADYQRVIDIIDLDYAYHHTPEDTEDKISQETLQAVGDVAVALLRGL